jgi:CheY-like chemotaxis protein
VALAYEGTGAMKVLETFRPDVGVFDIGLPGLTGYDLARRAREVLPGIRLIAVTGYGQAGDLEKAQAAGFQAHCAKPVSTSVLLGLISDEGELMQSAPAPGSPDQQGPRT